MKTASSAKFRTSRRWLTIGFVAVVVIAVVAIGGMWIRGGGQQWTVADLLDTSQEINPGEATSELCEQSGCVEAWRTEVGDFMRFDSAGAADYWATVLGDSGRRWENLVLDFGECERDLPERRLAIDTLYRWHGWN